MEQTCRLVCDTNSILRNKHLKVSTFFRTTQYDTCRTLFCEKREKRVFGRRKANYYSGLRVPGHVWDSLGHRGTTRWDVGALVIERKRFIENGTRGCPAGPKFWCGRSNGTCAGAGATFQIRRPRPAANRVSVPGKAVLARGWAPARRPG